MTFTITCTGLLTMSFLATAAAAATSEINAFNAALASDYQALAQAERAQGDARDGATYAARATAATAGQPTDPDQPELRRGFLKDKYEPELTQARSRLVGALEQGGRQSVPVAAARAQSTYDCWLEQASEDLQPDDIEACKAAFLVAVGEVESARNVVAEAPAPMPASDPDSDGDGIVDSLDRCPGTPPGTKVDANGCPDILMTLTGVNFKFDSSNIEPKSTQILDQAVDALTNANSVDVRIVGHTDSTGTDAYNQKLSEKRASAVRDYLVEHGIVSTRLSVEGQGEQEPIAPNETEEGRYQNRRVELRVAGAEHGKPH